MEKMANNLEKTFSSLLELCGNIDDVKQQRNLPGIGNRKVSPITVSLNKYRKVFEKTDALEHAPFVESIYRKFKKEILKGENEPKWLRNNSVVIQYGENLTNSNDYDKIKTIRVHLSIYFNDALRIRDEVEKELEGLPDDARSSRNELLFPDYFMLHWYRLCRNVVNDKDERRKLSEIVKSLESVLGVSHDEVPDQSAKPVDPFGSIMSNLAKNFGGMKFAQDAFAGMTSGMGGSNGVNGDQTPSVNTEDIGKIVNNILQNPNISKTINSMVSDLNSCSSLDQMIGKLASKLNDPVLTDVITSSIAHTTNSASSASIEHSEAQFSTEVIQKSPSPSQSPRNSPKKVE
jgi:hypothetical protein